jgi:hypothetical protein
MTWCKKKDKFYSCALEADIDIVISGCVQAKSTGIVLLKQ